MTHRRFAKKVCLLVIILATLLVVAKITLQRNQLSEAKKDTTFQSHAMYFYDEPSFLAAVQGIDRQVKIDTPMEGGVIPHHLLPSPLIARFFYKLSLQHPKKILLIGPNHPEKGDKLITTDWGWDTAFGKVAPDTHMISLFTSLGVAVNHEIIEHEHSVAGMLPFIKYFIPNAEVSTLILSNTLTLEELQDLSNNIASRKDSDTVIIAPIDFSHYLISEKAQQNDIVTWELLSKYNYQSLLHLNNDFVDGRTSLVLELLIMKKLGATNISMYEHTNSGILTRNPYSPTTSYFSFSFSK